MARTQSFDRDAVVRAARSQFWESGYELASIPDLERATGLSRSSIYNSFGSKRGLFDAAVQSYLDEVVRPRLRALTADIVSPDAITAYLTGLREAFLALDPAATRNGCLLINSAGSPIGQDEQVTRVISDYHAELHDAISRGVRAHAPTAHEEDRTRLTDAITGLVVASFAIARVDRAQAARSMQTALELLAAS